MEKVNYNMRLGMASADVVAAMQCPAACYDHTGGIKKLASVFPCTGTCDKCESCTSERDGQARGGVLRFELDRGVPLELQNPYPSLRVILAKKGTHF